MNLNIAGLVLPNLAANNPSKADRIDSTCPCFNQRRAKIFFEIKRELPKETRAEMKIAAPDVAFRLVDIYHASDSTKLRLLIERFFKGANHSWTSRLKT